MPHEYTHPNNTPLKWFNLIKRLLKLSLAFRVLFLFAGVSIPAIVLLSLNFAAVQGFKYMKWSGVMSFLFMMMLYCVFSSFGGNLSLILPATIIFAPTVVYFRKRRLLFSPNPYASGDYIEAFPSSMQRRYAMTRRKETSATFCKKCGTEFEVYMHYCPVCGKKRSVERTAEQSAAIWRTIAVVSIFAFALLLSVAAVLVPDYINEAEVSSYNSGYIDGQAAGVEDGRADGYADGYSLGYKNGYSIGKSEGANSSSIYKLPPLS